jgi:small GTP-binding protein
MSQKNRLCIVGAQCGKTSICWRLLHPDDEFINIEDPTIQSYFSIPLNKLQGDSVDRFKGENLTIMDTSGSNSYYELYDEWFSWGQIFILVYSIGDVNSFDAIPLFTDRVFKATKSKNVPLVLVGTKTDLPEEERKVLEIEGRSLAYRYKCPFIEVSAKTGRNINEAFRFAADVLHEFLTAPPPAADAPAETKKSPGKKTPSLQRKRSQSSLSPKLKSKNVTKNSSSNSGEFDGALSPRGAEQSPPLSPTPHREQYDMSGILQVKGKKKFVAIKDCIVTFYKSEKDAQSPSAKKESVMLMTSTVKPDMDKSSCKFQLINPQNTFNLKAPDVATMDQWIKAIQDGILSALNDVKSVKELKAEANQSSGPASEAFATVENLTGQKSLDLFHTSPDTKRCADCQNDYADWASINLGIVICIQCSGVHRSLGVQHSKVRSITLDDWDSFLIDMMKAIGNIKSNAVWEANPDNTKFPRPSATALRDEKERFIRAKYINKQFMKKETKSVQELKEEAVQVVKKGASGLARLVDLVAHGVDVNMPLDQETQQPNTQPTGNYLSLLHLAASVPDNCLIIEYLIKNNAEVNRLDATGATPLDWAVKSQPTKEKSREFKLLQLRGGTQTSSSTSNTNEPNSVSSTPRATNLSQSMDVADISPMSSTVGPVLSDKPPSNLPPMVARKATVTQPGMIKTASFPAPPSSAQLSPRPPTLATGSGPTSIPNGGITPPPSPKGPQSIQITLNRTAAPSNAVARTVSSPRTGPPPVPPPPSPRDQSAQPKTGSPPSPRDQSGPPPPSPPTSPRKGSLAANMPPNPRPPSGIVDLHNGAANGTSGSPNTPPIAIRPGVTKLSQSTSDAVGSKNSSPLSLSLEKLPGTPPKQPLVGSPTSLSLGFRPAPPKTPPPSAPNSPNAVSNPPSPLPRGGSAPNLVNSLPKAAPKSTSPKVPPRVTFREPPK